ncbi:hypothetical protein THRCLA_11740 [Thraustotheca clavata]|uniref:Uncharacterized protein n=1 Tax=Thraustotheca clavata TaxID=74557 RepID=A0A1V9Y6U5_9STRA|nr:hypothetical protein THRCLA_11740 [Thraustotheca clavata]
MIVQQQVVSLGLVVGIWAGPRCTKYDLDELTYGLPLHSYVKWLVNCGWFGSVLCLSSEAKSGPANEACCRNEEGKKRPRENNVGKNLMLIDLHANLNEFMLVY